VYAAVEQVAKDGTPKQVAKDGTPKQNVAPVGPAPGLYSIPKKDKSIPEYFITEAIGEGSKYFVPFDTSSGPIQYEEGEAYFIVTNHDKQYVVEADVEVKRALVLEPQADPPSNV